jgi:hypothetical protein
MSRHPKNVSDGSEEKGGGSDIDDLDITKVVRKDLKRTTGYIAGL